MKVYVAMQGCYSDKYHAGVFDSAERAMGAFEGKWTHYLRKGGRWTFEDWSNDLGLNDHVTILEEEVVADGPLHNADVEEVKED